VADARLYDSLREQPGWRRLHEMVEAKRERWMVGIAHRFMGPQKDWPRPEEIAYYQGYYFGALWVVRHPERAERNLERVAQAAWAMNWGEEDQVA